MDRIKVLLVDDSKFIRIALRKVLEKADYVEVIGEARDGEEAVRLARMLKPDLITMDIVMPGMDGISAIREILGFMNVPIIVISDHTRQGAKITFEALDAGAVDFIPKGSEELKLDLSRLSKDLLEKVRIYGSRQKSTRKTLSTEKCQEKRPSLSGAVDIVGIASSTGGPKVLPVLLKSMGPLPVPVLIAQHIPKAFSAGLAEWLSRETLLRVEEGHDSMRLSEGLFVVLPGGRNCSVVRSESGFILKVNDHIDTLVKPSADVLFRSMLKVAKKPVALILTGMGNDGTEGAKEFVKRGFTVIVQEPSTCVVCGMPCSAIEAGAYTDIMTVEDMGKKLKELCGAWNEMQKGRDISYG